MAPNFIYIFCDIQDKNNLQAPTERKLDEDDKSSRPVVPTISNKIERNLPDGSQDGYEYDDEEEYEEVSHKNKKGSKSVGAEDDFHNGSNDSQADIPPGMEKSDL